MIVIPGAPPPQHCGANQRHYGAARLGAIAWAWVHSLAQKAAEIALRLAAVPADGLRSNPQLLDEVEQLAVQILKDVAGARVGKSYSVGETSGAWRAMQPIRRQ